MKNKIVNISKGSPMTIWDKLALQNRQNIDLEDIYIFWRSLAKRNYPIVTIPNENQFFVGARRHRTVIVLGDSEPAY